MDKTGKMKTNKKVIHVLLGVPSHMTIKKWSRDGAPKGIYAITPTRKRFVGVTLSSAIIQRQKEAQSEFSEFPVPVSRREIKSWSAKKQ